MNPRRGGGQETKRITKHIIITMGCIVLFIAVLCGSIVYQICWKPTTIAVIDSDKMGYTVELQELGTAFLFGSSSVRVILKNSSGRIVDRFTDKIQNDGGTLDEGNISVSWHADYAVVILSGEEQENQVYQMNY